MGLRSFFAQLPGAAIQQAEIRGALEQAEEVFGRLEWILDAQRATLVDIAQQTLHALQHAHGACFKEDL